MIRKTLKIFYRISGDLETCCVASGTQNFFLLPLFQEGQLSVTGESMCTKYWLTALEV